MSELLAHEDALGSEVNIGNIVHFRFPNAQMIYFIPAQPKYVVVVNSGSTEEDKSCEYHIIEDLSAKNLSFFANDISEDIESYPSQSNNEQAFNKVYSHTELCLCDAEGRKIVLGKIESPPLAIKCNNIIGGASFVVSYQKKKNLHGDADEGASETCRIIYDVFNGGDKDYVEVVIRKPKEDSQSYDKQRVYRFYFDGRIEEIKEVLLMYSGGKDSVACIAKLIKEGYRVHLINFDNGCMQFTGLETELALKLELRYGKHKVYWGGVLPNIAYLREHQYLSFSGPFSEFINKYGDFTAGQLQCLNCRTAMYRVAILYARQNGIEYIAEGAREEQLFALEQKPMKEKYEKLCQEFGINLLWPVWKKTDDEIRDYHSDIYLGVSPEFLFPNSNGGVTGESKCPFGMPVAPESIMKKPQELQTRIKAQAETGAKYYDERLKPHIIEHLLDHENMTLRPSRRGGPVQFSNMGHDPARTYKVLRYDEFLALINSKTSKLAPQPLDNMPSRLKGRLVKVKRPDRRIKYSQKNQGVRL